MHQFRYLAEIAAAIGESNVREALLQAGLSARHDLLLPAGKPGAWTQIDHVAAVPGKIVVIETKNMAGSIYGSSTGKVWTQFLGGKKTTFQNPLQQNAKHIEAVRRLAGYVVPVDGLVVMAGSASFPKGMPEGCCNLRDLKKSLRTLAVPEVLVPRAELATIASASSDSSSDREIHQAAAAEGKRQAIARRAKARSS